MFNVFYKCNNNFDFIKLIVFTYSYFIELKLDIKLTKQLVSSIL